MPFQYTVMIVFIILGLLFIFVVLLIGSIFRPKVPNTEKSTIYECGERPIGEAWFNFNSRFYILALIFLIFDVEIALTIPVVVIFREWIEMGKGILAFTEIFLFLLLLALSLVYVWRNKDIDWIKKLDHVSPLKEDERKYYHY